MKKNISNQKPKPTPKPTIARPKRLDFQKWALPLNILLLLIFIVLAFYALAISNKDLVFKIQEFSLFLPTRSFFYEQFRLPGALLTYLNLFCTQFFYYPWLGSSLFIAIALLVQLLFVKVFDLSKHLFSYTFVIPFALLLGVTQLGYLIFAIKLQYFIFALSLGWLFALLLLWLYTIITKPMIRTLYLALVGCVLYPLLGFYALLTILFFVMFEVRAFIKNKNLRHFYVMPVGLIFIGLTPYLYYAIVYSQLDFASIYNIGLPQLFDSERFCWIPVIFIGIFTLICYLCSLLKLPDFAVLGKLLLGSITYLASLYGFLHFSYTDRNFYAELSMGNAVSENRWDDVLTQARQLKDEPTRLLVMYPRLALQKLNRGGDELFQYSNGNKEPNSPWSIGLLPVAGKQLFYQYGKTNYSYQAAIDDMVERGLKVDDLHYLVKNALLNREFKLAQKYNDVLALTYFYKDKAAYYQRFINQPTLMNQDAEFSTILPLSNYENEVFDAGVVETYLLNDFARNRPATLQYAEIAIQNALILRNSNLFWSQFLPYAQLVTRIPRHYQEAAILFSFYEQSVDIQSLNIDPAIIAEFHEFEHFLDQNRANTKEMNKNLLRPTFGHTFWFYFFFSEPIVSA